MKNKYSLLVCCIVSLVMLTERLSYSNLQSEKSFTVTTWDAFGYYIYLPSIFIYHDATDLKWLPGIDKKYHVIGDRLYQAGKYKNGNYVFNYLGGVAIMQSPF